MLTTKRFLSVHSQPPLVMGAEAWERVFEEAEKGPSADELAMLKLQRPPGGWELVDCIETPSWQQKLVLPPGAIDRAIEAAQAPGPFGRLQQGDIISANRRSARWTDLPAFTAMSHQLLACHEALCIPEIRQNIAQHLAGLDRIRFRRAIGEAGNVGLEQANSYLRGLEESRYDLRWP